MGISTGGGARRAVTIIATALAASAAFSASALADPPSDPDAPIVVGPSNLSIADPISISGGSGVEALVTDGAGHDFTVPANGTITRWRANFACADGGSGRPECGQARLLVLRSTATPGHMNIADQTGWLTPEEGVNEFPVDVHGSPGAYVAVELKDATLRYSMPDPFAMHLAEPNAVSGGVVDDLVEDQGEVPLFNVDLETKVASSTKLEISPSMVVEGDDVTYDVNVEPVDEPEDPLPTPTGTVALSIEGTPIVGCETVALVNGEGECTAPSPSAADQERTVDAKYSGDAVFKTSKTDDQLSIIAKSTVVAKADPDAVAPNAQITYWATITHTAQVESTDASVAGQDYGTVDFSVDSFAVNDCQQQPVDADGKASCTTNAPMPTGPHTMKAEFSGTKGEVSPGEDEADFTVARPDAVLSGTSVFGDVAVGQEATRTVTLENIGIVDYRLLNVFVAPEPGAFTIADNQCTAPVLKPAETCTVTIRFKPAAAETYTGLLQLPNADDLMISANAGLSGTGVVAPEPTPTATPTPEPPAPTATPTPEPPAPTATPEPPAPAPTATPVPTPPVGAKLAPGAKPTFTVTAPPASGGDASASAAPVLSMPLSCPAAEECLLDGSLKIATATLSKSARAAAANTRTVARFSRVQIAAGSLKTVKLKLDPAFVKSAQKRGIRKIKATLTINTVLGSGQRTSTQQVVTVLLPKAPKKKAAPKVAPRFTG